MSTDVQAQWLIQAKNNDIAAFSRLVEVYQAPVYNLCYRMLGNRQDAEDAAQETFMRAFRSIKKYDPQRPFKTWLLTIASRYCIDQYRKRRLPTVDLEPFVDFGLPDAGPGPEAALGRKEQDRQMQQVLHRLKPNERACIIMKYWHDMSLEEISEALDLTVPAVKSYLYRARKELARTLADQTSQPANSPLQSERMHHESPAI
ncbi:MAG: sigma-70 family RNA polymerase sigma factor [Anaerolineales bacterium]|nr:sigma-70 family RNA polymerase sigma factor [Anaerolineales bacterium]